MTDPRRRELDPPAEHVPQEDPGLELPDDDVTLRPLSDREEFEACEALQRHTWGQDFDGCVPALLLELQQKTGGLVGGAFEEGELLGFVFGFAALEDGIPYHWSHMLAVRDDRRGEGIGRRLKLFQRERLLDRGIEVVCWSFDPMVARNAHLNLNGLGAEVLAYVPDMYGDTESPLHGDLDTDRLVAYWELGSNRVEEAVSGDRRVDFTPFARGPEVGLPEGEKEIDEPDLSRTEVGEAPEPAADESPDFPDAERVRIEIPPRLDDLREEDPEMLAAWRDRVRDAFTHYLERGYGVTALWRPPGTDRSAYCLEHPEAARRSGR